MENVLAAGKGNQVGYNQPVTGTDKAKLPDKKVAEYDVNDGNKGGKKKINFRIAG